MITSVRFCLTRDYFERDLSHGCFERDSFHVISKHNINLSQMASCHYVQVMNSYVTFGHLNFMTRRVRHRITVSSFDQMFSLSICSKYAASRNIQK